MNIKGLRRLCGSLVAKVKKIGIELKCRKCKRVAVIPLAEEAALRIRLFFDHAHEEETSVDSL